MKNKLMKAILIAMFALFAGYNVYTSQRGVDLSALALDNVEALAGEWENNDCHMNNSTWICCPWSLGVACYCYM
ncbi:NVEALA domain-containing protein [uncultured Bacteroides sp.]|uniref:NVEALA domain-containing protein n=1 Tax=uncultured Bacteroides sp. TaxID=162156 RepID=UPI002AAC2F9B|nr:NVEALA domain-containing protein [uncultured Bacteroides sp.]